MSISMTLANALSGLTATGRMAQTVASNIANANTDGYGRREVALSSQVIGKGGAGVQVDGVTRIVDRGILADRRLADAERGAQQAGAEALERVEQLVGAPGDASSIAGRIAALEQALATASADPASTLRLNAVSDRLGEVASTLNRASDGLAEMRARADDDIAAQVTTLNEALARVEVLNDDIARARYTGLDESGLKDQRQVVIDKIAGIVPIRLLSRDNGSVAVISQAGQVLLDDRAAQIGFSPVGLVTADMSLAGGTLSGLSINGKPVASADGVGKLVGGALGASFQLRDETLPGVQAQLDEVAQDLILRLSDPAADPTIPAGGAGLLTDNGSPLDPLDVTGLSGRIAVNAAVDRTAGGDVTLLRDGLNAAAAGPVGEARQIDAWIGALAAKRTPPAGGLAASAAGLATRVSTSTGSARVDAEEQLGFATARWETMREAELISGVDSDREMQMLLRIEQAYAANARVMTAADSMIRQLMEI
ncbi:flagellar hook-associated protein FlgK [Pseudoroseicyclus aestuarii]|uniref:Flagellar hook-associated protein 1 n=1 Tax=Pseudoroseicyclus aestuarii TaxID=1795041 RepID=A0A318SXP7_9RHOB|nr:flagellar hook-associated protein FlgK [Pseudoroseicyclus aestuarii]PYE84607.1 flagellar hook-associated protein 1 FlgK [Pseudoroseicyclus aestuarii]